MHAPAYCPVVLGAKADDQRAVFVEVKKTMVMDSMFIVMLDDSMDIGPAVEEGMAMLEVAPIIAMPIDADAESMMGIVVCIRARFGVGGGERRVIKSPGRIERSERFRPCCTGRAAG